MTRDHQFAGLRASELYCPRCRTARPVRERLLLVLPRGELHEYRCAVCGESLGTRTVTVPVSLQTAPVPPPGMGPGSRRRRPSPGRLQ